MDELLEFLYKYRNFEDPYMINIIKNSSLYFSQVKNFNDPFDLRLDYKRNYSRKEKILYLKKLFRQSEEVKKKYKISDIPSIAKNEKLFREINKNAKKKLDNLSILSLSSDPKNILMWSHYSHKHTGLVFEFKYKESKSYFKEATKVIYDSKYDLFNLTIEDDKRNEELKKMFLKKYLDWQYEKEYRVIEVKKPSEEEFNKLDLTSIIFGLETETKNIEMIKELCAENGFEHVKFKKMEKVYGKFELKIVDL